MAFANYVSSGWDNECDFSPALRIYGKTQEVDSIDGYLCYEIGKEGWNVIMVFKSIENKE